ncbi:zinc ABC transporter substrate-binding protein ZnuA [Vibrio sinaloensis]|uniref:zinc ABC transporter substrate-binding protein ZnuA n=1 Tax=Photobacterium sp. (strain ATCC 43367) TaxID=379097 RepID=UPI00057D6D09|nr:zinc ABC transporter substrate-binding protein ZnuA [Vibrio sinaloensis]KHT45140.1 zinc ABC transporter substrate-binding protein [Vibrio sinaloensis]
MKRIFSFVSVLLAAFSANAAIVLTSIKPIQMIATELTQEVSQVDVLIPANASPHDYALRPSDVKRIQSADMIVWFGNDLEPFLAKILENRDSVLTLSDVDGLELREYNGDHHDHHGHDHGSHDPHFWLGYKTTKQVAKAIVAKLSRLDEKNAQRYQDNLAAFLLKLEQQQVALMSQLTPVKEKGYYVFHDAYGYFESDFELNHLGHFTVSPDRKPGAKTLIKIRKALSSKQAVCVFSEPQFTPAVIDSVTRGSDARVGVLDPLGTSVVVQPGSYFQFRQNLADSFFNCLGGV